HLGERAGADWASALWAIYADADRLWIVAPWSRAQEAINVFWTSALNVWLIWAIVTRRAYRHVLQLALGSYLSYSVILYWLAGHLSGYEGRRSRARFCSSAHLSLSRTCGCAAKTTSARSPGRCSTSPSGKAARPAECF